MDNSLRNFMMFSLIKNLNSGRESPSKLKDSALNHASKYLDEAKSSPAFLNDVVINKGKNKGLICDAYGNTLTSTGTHDKVQSFSTYGFSNDTLNWPLWLALYNDSWIFKRAIDKPAIDMVRCGIKFNGTNDFTKIYRDLKNFRNELIELIQWGRLFGGSIAVMMFDNMKDADYSKPLNIDIIKNYKSMKLYVTDRWYGVAVINQDTVTNMKSLDYGKPKMYQITFANGHTLNVHHDYILRFENRSAPKLIKTGYLQGWGYSEGSHILGELARDDELKSSITSLVNKALIEVIKMPGMRGVFLGADEENQQQLEARLEQVNWGRTFNSLTFLDKEDEYSQNEFSGLNGLSSLLENNMWLVSAALEMQGVLFGDLKEGFSNDTDALERYDETILNLCESSYRTVLTKLSKVLFLHYNINENVDFEFISLLIKKHDKEDMESLNTLVDTLSKLLNDGIINTTKYAKILSEYSRNKKVNIDFTNEELKETEDREKEMLENINLDEV